jgi:hypothetical protein
MGKGAILTPTRSLPHQGGGELFSGDVREGDKPMREDNQRGPAFPAQLRRPQR